MANARTVSRRGVELVKKYEGCKLKAYQCPSGVWTIGYGHTKGVHRGDTLSSEEKAAELLRGDLAIYGAYVNQYSKNGKIGFPLNQNQFDALTSFCFNCGAGNLAKLVSNRTAGVVANKMLEYNRAGGIVLKGLTERRKEERRLFLSLEKTRNAKKRNGKRKGGHKHVNIFIRCYAQWNNLWRFLHLSGKR